MLPNLYLAPLDDALRKQAEADPFGTVTLWTYFHNSLAEATQRIAESPPSDDEIHKIAELDLVYAAFLALAKTPDAALNSEAKVFFIKALNRCVISSPDIVEGSVTWMQEETGVSVLDSSLLPVLLAVTVKHHNHAVLQSLATHAGSHRSIFDLASPLVISQLKRAGAAAGVWDALVSGGWIAAPDVPSSADIESPPDVVSPGNKLRDCTKRLPSTELASYFPHIPRTLYTGISPYAKWPGDLILVKDAVARDGPEGLEVLRQLVEVGGMDVNDADTWWKEGDHDPRDWNPKCHDGSDCRESPLHMAIDKADLPVIEYLLTHGARSCPDAYGRTPWDRALLREKKDVLELLESHGWRPAGSVFSKLKLPWGGES